MHRLPSRSASRRQWNSEGLLTVAFREAEKPGGRFEIGKAKLRELVEVEGQPLLEKARRGELRPDWQVSNCSTGEGETRGSIRLRVRLPEESER